MGEGRRAFLWTLLSEPYIANHPPYNAYDIPYIIYDTTYFGYPSAYFGYAAPSNVLFSNAIFCHSESREL